MNKTKPFKTKELTLIAALTALEIVLSRFLSINAWNIKIGFSFVPVAIAAIILGPIHAGIIAALGDFIGAILFPIGAYFPGFTLTAFLTGICFGVFLSKKRGIGRIFVAVATNQLVLSLLLNSLWISILYGSPFLPLLGTRLIQCAVLFPLQFAVILLISKSGLCSSFISRLTADRKKEMRQEIKKLSKAMSADERALSDRAVFENIVAMPEYKKAGTVFTYVSVDNEIDTRTLLERVLSDGKRLCVPLISGKTMEIKEVSDLGILRAGTYNIPEPTKDAVPVSPDEIDLAVIPCVTCSKSGERLGRGGGYYDRFLKGYKGAAAAVCRECFMRDKIPLAEHDVNIPLVVTDRAVYRNSLNDPVSRKD